MLDHVLWLQSITEISMCIDHLF